MHAVVATHGRSERGFHPRPRDGGREAAAQREFFRCGHHHDIRPATTPRQHHSASQLVQRMYAWRGYRTDAAAHTPDDVNRLVLAAWRDDRVMATLTLGGDSPAGLLSESLYRHEITGFRQQRKVLCEISRLAVDHTCSSRELLTALFRAAYQYACRTYQATDLLIEVNPRHAGYYQRQYGFRQAGGVRLCPRVDAPAILLHRELDGEPAAGTRTKTILSFAGET